MQGSAGDERGVGGLQVGGGVGVQMMFSLVAGKNYSAGQEVRAREREMVCVFVC